ncbi:MULTISPECIES: ribose-phosphate diphosphokinase [Nosocomiicoccus]|uniref:Ribose-phosphate pyrophosphokinase n=1 Tax=Nosocomiicoccus massiliensis TaxID=1232430 RepID=A0AAF1BR10_9STAP|nr:MULTISPECIES: ribose-phosphate diphosphokinase [Nosocomiicoccus]MDK6863693.1 ribose-phosphate diphosphokinase [Nosocomiicoccus ampullae]OFO49911.1 ribose-phosphate pyrophosphokinase [Nosocomiicoccus sp. HMSC059G07]OFS61628.1 ribose-phosphate pyrophosphokinase [Nosocomiicoccus sp. HMSC09A07]WOS95588.1 ribose-phosphate diphosphokinase [Nosocomiicoccus massiliensis]
MGNQQNIKDDMKVFTLSANEPLAQEIADHLGVELGKCKVNRFSDQEVQVDVLESVRGKDIFVVQPTSEPVNAHLMELLIMIDALRRASARRINLVIPYYGYARQDRKSRPREPITAKLVANLLETAGADRVVSIDLHAAQIQGFFDIPIDHLTSVPLITKYFEDEKHDLNYEEEVVIVSPDHGGVTRARRMAERLGSPIAIIDKRRPRANVAEVMSIVGDIKGKTAIVIDDIIDTGGTIKLAADKLIEEGATEVYVCCSHPVLSGKAIENLQESQIKEVIVTNSIKLPEEKQIDKIKQLSVGELLAEAITRIHEERSVSRLFD